MTAGSDLTSGIREKITSEYLKQAALDGLDDSDIWPMLLFIAGPKFDEYVELVRQEAIEAGGRESVSYWKTSNAFIDAECRDRHRNLWYAVMKHLGYKK